jgi:type II secretory pathway pseudopilin PulG
MELLVAIGLFSIIVAIAVGGFTNALRTQREVAALIAAQSNAGLALEQMAREIRTGYFFCHDSSGALTCSCSLTGFVLTCSDLNFENASGAAVGYSLVDNALARSENGSPAQPITSGNVTVPYLVFTLFGNAEGGQWSPRITISIGVAPNSTDPTLRSDVLNLQTTVSARGVL